MTEPFDETNITLKYMANNLYSQIENNNPKQIPSKEDCKFYKQRTFELTKSMFKKKYPNERLKKIHLSYVNELIEYLKHIDTVELMQEEYDSIKLNDKKETDEQFDLNKSNNLIIQENKNQDGNLDNFIIKKIQLKEKEKFPNIKSLNIKTLKHKNKGLQS